MNIIEMRANTNIHIFQQNENLSKCFQKSLWQSFENKFINWLFFSIFHAFRCGALLFYHSFLYVGVVLAVRLAIFRFSNKLKISQNVFQKSLCQSFENKYHKCFPKWCPPFLPQPSVCALLGVKSPIFSFSNKLKISQKFLQKSLWQSFENENYELPIF